MAASLAFAQASRVLSTAVLGRPVPFPDLWFKLDPGWVAVGGVGSGVQGHVSRAESGFQGESPEAGFQACLHPGCLRLCPVVRRSTLLSRTASWSVRTSTMTTATSPTAPSAVGGVRCSCAGTTTAAGKGPPSLQCPSLLARSGDFPPCSALPGPNQG